MESLSWRSTKVFDQHQISDLVRLAYEYGLQVHPYTVRANALPAYARSMEELLRILLLDAGVDGIFTDHPDRGVSFIRSLIGVR